MNVSIKSRSEYKSKKISRSVGMGVYVFRDRHRTLWLIDRILSMSFLDTDAATPKLMLSCEGKTRNHSPGR